MPAYLEQFFREKVAPYTAYVEALHLGYRVEIREEARSALSEGIEATFDRRCPTSPPILYEILKKLYDVTTKLGLTWVNCCLVKVGHILG